MSGYLRKGPLCAVRVWKVRSEFVTAACVVYCSDSFVCFITAECVSHLKKQLTGIIFRGSAHTAQWTRSVLIIQTSHLMPYMEIISVCSAIHMKRVWKVVGSSDFGSFLSSSPEYVNPLTISRISHFIISHTAVASQNVAGVLTSEKLNWWLGSVIS